MSSVGDLDSSGELRNILVVLERNVSLYLLYNLMLT